MDKRNPYHPSCKPKRLLNNHSTSELKTQTYKLPEDIINIDFRDKPRNIAGNWKEQFNRKNLEKNIKMIEINNLKFDEENDDLIVHNIPKLKQIVEDSSAEAKLRLQHFQPMFVKQNFKSQTIKRFKSASGNYFGVP